MDLDFSYIVEILGTIAFAMSGAFAAIQKRFDPFGVLIIAFVTALGGGTIRDLLIGVPVAWLRDMTICYIVFFTAIFAMIFKSIETNFEVTLFLFDSIGLAIFTIIGLEKGIVFHLHPAICIVLGTITGCFGGVIRDILLNRIPLIFRKEIYATASIIGGVLFLLLKKYTDFFNLVTVLSTILLIVVIRTLAVKYHWRLPKFYTR